MNWPTNFDGSQIWLALMCVVLALSITGGLTTLYFVWKKRGIDHEPLPQCNLEERLAQIADSSMLQAKRPA
jgi:hypothetical protein